MEGICKECNKHINTHLCPNKVYGVDVSYHAKKKFSFKLVFKIVITVGIVIAVAYGAINYKFIIKEIKIGETVIELKEPIILRE